MVAKEQMLDGQYRQAHQTIVSHSEEIGFYKGQDWEKEKIQKKFKELISY